MRNNNIFYEVIKPYITGDIKSCSYCDKLEPLILYYGKHFYVTVAIGAYMPGYIQLCSYQHRTSATGILPVEREEFQRLSNAIRNSFMKVYGNYGIGFEHGQAGTCMWRENYINSLCHHMHVHFLPAIIDIHEDILARFNDFTEVRSIDDMIKIRQEVLCGRPYLYFSLKPNKGCMYNVANLDVPRQFLRKCVADKLGIPQKADWQEYPGVEHYEQTIRELSKPIAKEMSR
jgi:diadenosine tetraphosphate (Ap4A) HIT family hydrolase